MKTPKRNIVVRLWPSGDAMLFLVILLAAILFAGEPDLMDAVISRIMITPIERIEK